MNPIPIRWGFVFLRSPGRLSDDERLDLVRMAAAAWFAGQAQVSFDWEGCCGELTAGSDILSLGAFSGRRFTASLHFPDGSSSGAEFLVAETWLQASVGEVAEA